MAKNWKELTQAEKIEDLRQDVERIFGLLTDMVNGQRSLAAKHRGTVTKLNEVAKAVEALEKAQPRKPPKAR